MIKQSKVEIKRATENRHVPLVRVTFQEISIPPHTRVAGKLVLLLKLKFAYGTEYTHHVAIGKQSFIKWSIFGLPTTS